MIESVRGIVLRYIKHRETSIIITLLTDQLGKKTYIENGVRTGKSSNKNKMALFQPMTCLELIVYDSKKEINRIKECRFLFLPQTLWFDVRKSSILLFLSEVLQKTLLVEEKNERLFDFVLQKIQQLDHQEEDLVWFPLEFLVQFSDFVGLGLYGTTEVIEELQAHISMPTTSLIEVLSHLRTPQPSTILSFSKEERNRILDMILAFYTHHFSLSEFRTIKVLREL